MIEEKEIEKMDSENPAEEQVNLTEKDVKKVQDAIKEAQLDATKLSPENQRLFEEMLKVADMPIVINDKDMKLGKQELDVRELSRRNYRQMEFRQLVLNNVYLKQVVMSLTDVLRLLMVLLNKLGVEDIEGATDDVISKIEEIQRKKQEQKLN